MYKLLLTGLCAASFTFVFAQDIDKIKRDAERNQANRQQQSPKEQSAPKPDTKPAYSYDRPYSTDNCHSNSSSNSAGPFKAIGNLIMLIAGVQESMLEKEADVPEMTSLEYVADANISGKGGFEFRPRLRGNWGLFSTDARFYTLAVRNTEGRYEQLSYFDWQPVMINLAARRNFKWRIGTGVSHEYFTGNNYSEHTTQFELMPVEKLIAKAEGRWAEDYSTKTVVRKEANFSLEYLLKEEKHYAIFTGANASYNNLYETNPFWVFGPSFRIRLQ